MSMNIKSDQAHALARELAALENTSVTEAVSRALREALEHRTRQQESRIDRATATLARMRERITQGGASSLHEVNESLFDHRGLPK